MRTCTILFLMTLAASVGACRDSTGTNDATARAAGIYLLQPIDAEVSYGAPESGSMRLSRSGRAERDVTYRDDVSGRYRADGTFTVNGTAVEVRLGEESGGMTYAWIVYGTLEGARLTFRYPGPADGEIVERYVRVSRLVP